MARSVQGKTAIVTGAGSGINLEFARVLLKNGCNVVIGDLALQPEARKLVDEYSSGSGPKAVYQKTDVSSWKDLNALFKTAETSFGNYDIVCPGAGIFEPGFSNFWHPPGSERSKDDTEGDGFKTIDVNLVHPLRSSQLAISHFLSASSPASQENPKTILLIASIAAEMAFAPVPLYVTSKWGLRGFIYTMGELEATRNIRVAGVAPGIVRTPIWLDDEEKRKMVYDSEGKEQTDWTTPEEVAEVMYKICTQNELTTAKGEKLPVKGGSLIEVIHGDVRDVPIYGAQPPGTETNMQGLTIISAAKAWEDMNAAVAKPNWGRV